MKNTIRWAVITAFMVLCSHQAFAQDAAEIEKSQQDIAAEKRMRKRIETPRRAPAIIEDKTETGEEIKESEEMSVEEPKGGAEK